jgi:restriction system protein
VGATDAQLRVRIYTFETFLATRRTAVQAKRWNKRVGVKAVQEAVAAKGYYNCGAALVVANREFTRQAKRLARANNVELWGRDALVGRMLGVSREATEPAPAGQLVLDTARATTEPEITSPPEAPAAPPAMNPDLEQTVCVTCGATVTAKVREYCLGHRSRFDGKIYCFKHQRTHSTAARLDT